MGCQSSKLRKIDELIPNVNGKGIYNIAAYEREHYNKTKTTISNKMRTTYLYNKIIH